MPCQWPRTQWPTAKTHSPVPLVPFYVWIRVGVGCLPLGTFLPGTQNLCALRAVARQAALAEHQQLCPGSTPPVLP